MVKACKFVVAATKWLNVVLSTRKASASFFFFSVLGIYMQEITRFSLALVLSPPENGVNEWKSGGLAYKREQNWPISRNLRNINNILGSTSIAPRYPAPT